MAEKEIYYELVPKVKEGLSELRCYNANDFVMAIVKLTKEGYEVQSHTVHFRPTRQSAILENPAEVVPEEKPKPTVEKKLKKSAPKTL